jgi:pyruvate dehydrogenase E2 component (dihydrolipoamide acetyltransferase)
MADITMPKMGFDMTEGTLVRWLKNVGDEVQKGEPVAEIETDKVTIEVEAFESGTITELVAKEGDVVPVGEPIARLGVPGEAVAAKAEPAAGDVEQAETAERVEEKAAEGAVALEEQEVGEGGEVAAGAARETEAGVAAPAERGKAPREGYGAEEEVEGAAPAPPGERVLASPLAKRLAEEHELNLREISGSGPGGRIVRRDVEAFLRQKAPRPAPQPAAAPAAPAPEAAPPPPGPGVRREPLSRMRQTIARRLTQSKGPVPHFYVTTPINMDAAIELRQQLNASGDVKITVNDMVVKAAALAMKKFPVLNASYAGDALDYHDYINVSIAVATDNGLLAPAVTDVDKKSLGTVSAEAKELIQRTREGKATPEELQRGTFSVSNLGMYPVESFSAILNPPQATILAIGSVTEEPVVRDGAILIGKVMRVTISIDHRVSDGAVAAEYMQELKRLLENPMQILL